MIQLFGIVPCFNAEKTIRRCFQSIKDSFANYSFQSPVLTSLELVFVDDGSDDQTKSILESLQADHLVPITLTVLSQSNCGAGEARNAALDYLFRQERFREDSYLFFADSDDEVSKDFFQILLAHASPKTIVCGDTSAEAEASSDEALIPVAVFLSPDAQRALLQYSEFRIRSGCVNKVFPYTFFQNVRFPCIQFSEDLATNIRVFGLAAEVIHVKACTYVVHRDGYSLTSRPFDGRKARAWLDSLYYFKCHDWAVHIKPLISQMIVARYLEILPRATHADAIFYIRMLGSRRTVFAYKPPDVKEAIKKWFYLCCGGRLFWVVRHNKQH